MKTEERYDFFRHAACELCGDCLTRCQYLGLGRAEAVVEMSRLRAGLPSRVVADRCISCYACNAFCPNDCLPYELILGAWHERYRKDGLPMRAAYLMPDSSPNFRTDVVRHLSAHERGLLRTWKETPPEGEFVIYPGCNTLSLPHLLDVSFLRGIPVSGDFDLCCGEMYYRMGLFDVVARRAEKLSEHYRGREIGTMLFVCPAGLNMFRNVLPDRFGAEFPFRTMYLGEYLLGKVESGEIALSGRLARRVAVHDSCHGRILGDEIMETVRRLYGLMGLEMRELSAVREEGLCCGMAAGCRRHRPDDIFLAALKELRRARLVSPDELAVYCGGCQLILSMMRWLLPGSPPVRHLLEILAEAAGEDSPRPASRRALRILSGVVRAAGPRLLSRETFRL